MSFEALTKVDPETLNTVIAVLVKAPPLLLAVIFHEIAHGLAAERLGDPTARESGRISLNPIKHIDPFMTILLPGILIFSGSPVVFGGAKPVPINPMNFRDPRRGMMWTAFAGPVTNFLLAGICYLVLVLLRPFFEGSGLVPALVASWLIYGVFINVILGVFNLIPIPPLDGGRVAVGLLPLAFARRWARLERFGLILLVLLLAAGAFDFVFEPVIRFLTRM